MSFEKWKKEYKAIKNENGEIFDGYYFGTEEAIDNIKKYKGRGKIWTLIEEEGEMFLVSGIRFVNRLGYFFTRKSSNYNKIIKI